MLESLPRSLLLILPLFVLVAAAEGWYLQTRCGQRYDWRAFFASLGDAVGRRLIVGVVGIGANLLYQFWIHTELIGRLGPLEWVLNTPRHHRVHHARNDACLDRNFGGVLIVYDRLFGTFAEERADLPCSYGLVEPLTTNNPVRIASHGWQKLWHALRDARGLRECALLLFGPPEWRPENIRSASANSLAR